MVAFSFMAMMPTAASAETRTLKLYFIHTKERAEITFKRNGRYDQAGLRKVNQFLRDWRRNEPTKMDPRLLDLVWEAYQEVGARDYINVVSAYRSPATNSMLRSRSKGVANKSQHMLGKAMDFYIPGVKLSALRAAGLKMQGGGVGYYPTSGSPFVHFDVGNVRHWPKMSRRELVALFPNGQTLHVPSDGKPLPGYEQAMASYKSRRNNGGAGIALASASSGGSKRSGGLLAAFFGGGADEEEDNNDSASTRVAAAPAPRPRTATRQQPAPAAAEAPRPSIQVVSPEEAQRANIPGYSDEQDQTPETIIAALPARSVPVPGMAPRPQAPVAAEVPVAQTPDVVPFGQASAPLPEQPVGQEDAQVALNVPLPTRRPDYTPPAELKTTAEEEALLLALASPEKPDTRPAIPMPIARPETAQAALAPKAPTPSAAPVEPKQDQFAVAALPSQQEPMGVSAPVADKADAAAIEAEIKAGNARVAALTSRAAPEQVASIGNDIDPAAASTGVKTTRKSAKPSAQDSQPDRKTVVVAAEPKAARWALGSGEKVATVSDGTTAPSFAYNLVRTAPREVYTAGFQQTNGQQTGRFSGKAVEFLSVARFATN
ncbi:DUF882 domain-containing protein [Mesorhizobium sp. SB112]|uniref:DUF882 domain-containing protein n=1 Tax=Mesorhizobium sp. SB112 TaxID=3151853 RepID=UPI00326555A1